MHACWVGATIASIVCLIAAQAASDELPGGFQGCGTSKAAAALLGELLDLGERQLRGRAPPVRVWTR